MPVKPSEKEEEYFTRIEAQKKKKLVEERERQLAIKDREERKKIHWMHCPKCGSTLETIKYKNIEVDHCFHCNGTWLDAGELEQIAKSESLKNGFISSLTRLFK
jgi:hypothetical protein